MLLPEDPQAKKSLVSLSICQIAACFNRKMVRNYHNFIKSNLNFRFSKRLGDFREFWGTSRKKVIPHSPGMRKANSPNLEEQKKGFLIFLIPRGRNFNEELGTLVIHKTPCSSNSIVQTFGHNLQHELDIIRAYWPALNS